MQIVPIADTRIRKRQRTAIDKAALTELKEKIAIQGVLHPPVYWLDPIEDPPVWVLTAGERRTLAIQALHAEGREVRCNNVLVPPGHLPITRLDDSLDEIGRHEAELDENVVREDLSWQDKARAYSDLHAMRQAQNPQQTLTDTGKELIERGIESSKRATQNVSESVIIAKHLHNDKIANARNANEAYNLILKQEEEKMFAELARRRLAVMPSKPLVEIRHGDSLLLLPDLDSDMVDLIVADPPYGIKAEGGGFASRTVHHHDYSDDPDTAKRIAQAIIVEGFRICKTRANLFMFCDIDLFPWLKLTAANMGWTPFRRPLIWAKSESEGLAPWAGAGPRITTEFIFYATKGQRGLNVSPIDVFPIRRVPRNERIHAAEKPVELLKALIQCSTLPGDFVLDPCCGSGSALVAAKELKRCGLGIEKDKDYFNTATANVFGKELVS